jgi:outer membrane protein assembly factor BamA
MVYTPATVVKCKCEIERPENYSGEKRSMFQKVTPSIFLCLTLCVIGTWLLGLNTGLRAQDLDSAGADTIAIAGKIIRSIQFTGKYKLRRYILYREIDSEPGKPLDLELLERDRRKVDGFGIFSRVDVYAMPEGDSVDIDFDLREVWTLLPTFSLGRTDGKLDWSVGVHERNFLGFYLQTVIRYRRFEGKNSELFTASFPRFLGKDLAVGFALVDQHEIDPLNFQGQRYDYDYLHKAVSGSLGHRLREKLYIVGSGGYDRENWQLRSGDTLGYAVPSLDYPRYFIGAGATLGRVYFDRYFYDGTDLSTDLTAIHERPDGRFNKWRISITGRRFIISGPLNFAFRARYQTSSEDERVPPFAISGDYNVRGYRDKEVRGDYAVIGNFEARLRTLNTRLFYSQLAVFADYGSIWGRDYSAGDAFANPYWSVGAGIRGAVKPLLGKVGRIDFAYTPDQGDFSIYFSTSQFF